MSRSVAIAKAVIGQPVTLVSATIVAVVSILAFAVPYLGLVDPEAMNALPSQPPGAAYWMGTDNFGRDILARIIWGARVALIVAIGSSALSTILGIVVGSVSGYYGGWVDSVLGRVFDIFLLIPTFFLVLLIVNLFGSNLGLTMFAIAITTWPRSARIMRAQVLSLKSRTYVQASLAAGASSWQALVSHVIPNGIAPLITDGAILMGLAILTEAGLSFLGLGDQNSVSWGRMIYEGQAYLRSAPWISIFPGVSLLILVSALNLLGDALNRALNPQIRARQRVARRRPPINASPEPAPVADDVILRVDDLVLTYYVGGREVRAVDGLSFALRRGESLGIVGESGCGKSSLGSALLQILPPNAVLSAGRIRIDGRDVVVDGRAVVERGQPRFQALRWTRVAIIFQSAMNALNPVFTVGDQLVRAYRLHRPKDGREKARQRATEVFEMIGIAPNRLGAYPHQLSGGMRQRAMIALSLMLEPKLLVADEPTTALDVLIQDQILGEIDALRQRLNLTLILISHDMGAVAETCERIAVMYAGKIVELASTAAIFERPSHPYTRALIAASPTLTKPRTALAVISGEAFHAGDVQSGCRFAPRCPMSQDICREKSPELLPVAGNQFAACHFASAVVEQPAGEMA
ncbi:dipeptide/oligopeptide/nickel ABC transporter permease/ATP-binding protein [Microvirga antarctica]|uniref:dipeptide/oligopeptide/nickel ABC transporter permease/ATP-binding protein n=1 Tax=Microvirga antarctica TaxID=2819233 RepID=UPI001B30EDAD|nr:dipeptide/oligopeptide/nickel ABC transporter permease/ATP-binding protein [Microvirga antarctica]